ncbi:MAG: hypothetical protein EP329_14255 [Deltaproteobacteria bacterium]|nr:MAG: hypothetical protein EP329_14255 [Deltaproteobacteria bacterium]
MATDETRLARDEQVDEQVTDWLDDTLTAPDREAFERELEADPALAREVKELETVVRALRRMPAEDAPPDFLRAVQGKIRRRSRGRFYGERALTRYRFPYEAVINAILLGLLMAVYIISMPTPDETPVPVAPAVAEGMAASSQAIEALAPFGTVALEPSAAPGEVALRVVVPSASVDAVKHALSAVSAVTRVDVTPTGDGQATVRVVVRAGAP